MIPNVQRQESINLNTMKHLLRKIFFWDAPAQGAFFGLTLLIVLHRCFWTIFIGVSLPVFLRNNSIGLMLFCVELLLGALAVIYSLVCLFHLCQKKGFSNGGAYATRFLSQT